MKNFLERYVFEFFSQIKCKILLVVLHSTPCQDYYRNSHLEVFLGKGVLKIRSRFSGEHPCQSETLIKLQLY